MTAAAPIRENAPFEEILTGLQKVVETLERGDLPLEESLRVFEEGMRLSKLGAQRLDDAESRVEQLLAREGSSDGDGFESEDAR